MATPMPQYQYDPLPTPGHIRLLSLQPGSRGDALTISLNAAFLPSSPHYEALSYVWGDANVARHISCEGASLRVTANLHDALSQLRLPNKPRNLWVDAVCINQSDLSEKSSQIQIMHQIYKSSQACVVWLGLRDEHTDIALDIMRRVSHIVCQRVGVRDTELEGYLQVHGPDPSQAADIGFHSALPDRESKEWQSVGHFLGRPWFSRTWVIQEAYFSPNLVFHCGERVTTYHNLYYTADWLRTNNPVMDPNLFSAGVFGVNRFNITRMRANNHERVNQSLADLLAGASHFKATDPRDKVYALMHFPAFQREYPDLIPNYCLTVEELYMDVAFQLMARKQDLYPLTHGSNNAKLSAKRSVNKRTVTQSTFWERLLVRTRRVMLLVYGLLPRSYQLFWRSGAEGTFRSATSLSLPSWVPNWNRGNADAVSVSSSWYQHFSAGKSDSATAAMAIARAPGHALRLRGLVFDTVEDVCGLRFNRPQDQQSLREPVFSPVTPWAPCDPDAPDAPYPTKPAVVTAYALVLTSGCRAASGVFPLRCADANVRHHEGDFVAWLSWVRTLPSPSPGEGGGESPYPPGLYARDRPSLPDAMAAQAVECCQRYGRMPPAYMLDRALIRTRRGLLGNAPLGVQQGDVVCILLGGAVPFILRPKGSGGFTLVGDAYVHGVMDGELVADWENVEPRLRDFDVV